MAELHTYNGVTHLTTVTDESISVTQSAETGAVGTGQLMLDDTPGTLSIIGQKDYLYTQSAASNTQIFRGFVGDREYERDEATPRVTTSRLIMVHLDDLNAVLGFRLIGADGKRPAETVAERGAWLMASDYVSGLFIDNGRCDFPDDKGMNATDYRNQHPGDVLGDMATASLGYNYHVQDYGFGPELIFRDDNASTADSSTLRISNVLADVDSSHASLGPTKTVAPSADAQLSRKPGRVVSKLAYGYAKGTVTEDRPATATAFNGERGGNASNANVKTAAKASDEAARQLWQVHLEEDMIECSVIVPDSAVNLVMAGWRIQAKFSHLVTEGYGSFTWFRVLERTVKPLVAEGTIYEITLKLSPQREAPPVAGIVQRTSARATTTPCVLTFANPPTIGNQLLICIARKDDATPPPPGTTGPLVYFGPGAWTEIETVDIDERFQGTFELYHGLSFYWKTVDSTVQSGAIGATYINAAIWELSGADLASATVVSATRQSTISDPVTMSAGSLGTVAVGDLAFLATIIVHNSTPGVDNADAHHDWLPHTPVASVFTERLYQGGYDGNSGIHAASYPPNTWMGDLEGDGSTVLAAMQRSMNELYGVPFNISQWAAIGLKVPPL